MERIEVVSVNLATPTQLVCGSGVQTTGLFKKPTSERVEVGSYGLLGDTIMDTSVHGGLDQAVYLYWLEDYEWWQRQLGKHLFPGTFGENIVLRGAADIDVRIGDRIEIGGLELQVTAPRVPCAKLVARMHDETFAKKFVIAARPGFYARVVEPGSVASGDEAIYVPTDQDYASIKEVFVEWHRPDKSPETLKRALESPIAKFHRAQLQVWFDAIKA